MYICYLCVSVIYGYHYVILNKYVLSFININKCHIKVWECFYILMLIKKGNGET